ncbi:retrovirus-related pol polyprotein from transposon TNT 1-94 [Tanacetum coccineum]
MVEKKSFDEVVLRCSRLENHNVNLELKLQHQKGSFLNNRALNNQNVPEILEFFKINEWQAKLDAKDVSIANLRKHIESLKGKNVVEKVAQPNNAKVIAPGMFKLDLEPLSPKVLRNKDAHIDYIKHTQENADILRELVKHARALRPLDSDLDFACKYAKQIQEEPVYVTAICPSLLKPSEKLVAITPMNKNRKVRFTEPATSSSNTRKQSSKRKKTWKPTGKIFTDIGYRWKPIGWTFTLAGNTCPLTRITSTTVEPLKETTSKPLANPNPEIKIYRRKTKVAKSVDLNSEPNILGSRPSNISEPNKHWLSTISNSPSTSLVNFRLSKLFSETIRFGNDQIAKIKGYGDYQLGNVTILQVYYVKGLGHNLFFMGQFCDSDLEVAFRKHTCYVRNLDGKVKFLRSKDEALEVIINCLKQIQVRLNATVRNVQTNNRTEFVNQTLREYYEIVRISHQTSAACTPQQNGVVKRRNRTLVEAARTILIFSKAPLFLWAEADIACYTQNRSLVRLCYNKTPYDLMHNKKLDLSYLHVFASCVIRPMTMRIFVN